MSRLRILPVEGILDDERRLVGIMVGRAPHHVRNHPAVDPVVAVHQKFEILLVQMIEARFFLVGYRSGICRHGEGLRRVVVMGVRRNVIPYRRFQDKTLNKQSFGPLQI